MYPSDTNTLEKYCNRNLSSFVMNNEKIKSAAITLVNIYSFFTIFLITMNIISAKNNACKNQVSTPIRINVQITSLIKALSSYPYNKILTKALHRLKTI